VRAIFFRRGVRVPEFDLVISWPDLIRAHGLGVIDRPPEEYNRPTETFFLSHIDGETAVYVGNGPDCRLEKRGDSPTL
jgi:hypothetical protein